MLLNQVLNQIWRLLLVVPLTNQPLKWSCGARQMPKRLGWSQGLLRKAEPIGVQRPALGGSRGSELAAVSLVRYCSLGPADFNRIKRRVCLVMETTSSAPWSLYGFSSHQEANNCICGREGTCLNSQNTPQACSQCWPLVLSANFFWNLN